MSEQVFYFVLFTYDSWFFAMREIPLKIMTRNVT